MQPIKSDIVTRVIRHHPSAVLSAAAAAATQGHEPVFPTAERSWVDAPVSRLTTMQTRREWFRVMQWNTMADAWTKHPLAPVKPAMTVHEAERRAAEPQHKEAGFFTTTPVANVDVRAEEGAEWTGRFPRIMDQIQTHDPDILLLNEVGRPAFNREYWRVLRGLGYGGFFTSSRFNKAMAPSQAADPKLGRHAGTLRYEEDIGNAIFFHKGRFFPCMLPGTETPSHIPFVNIVGLRDRVVNQTMLCFLVQLTPGADDAAVEGRRVETEALLKLIKTHVDDNTDRSFLNTFVVGDLNNTSDDEPCVELLREKYFSAYDTVGGPRWTCSYHSKPDPWGPGRHLHPRFERLVKHPMQKENEEIEELVKGVMAKRAKAKRGAASAEAGEAAEAEHVKAAAEPKKAVPADGAADAVDAAKSVAERQDDLVQRTSDFMLYDEAQCTVLRVLDVPREDEIKDETGAHFPNTKMPSHHVPLVADFCWNNFAPKERPQYRN